MPFVIFQETRRRRLTFAPVSIIIISVFIFVALWQPLRIPFLCAAGGRSPVSAGLWTG